MSDQDESLVAEASTPDRPLAIPPDLPLLPLRDTVLFPNSFMPLAVAREASVRLIDEARARGIVVIDCQIASPHLQSLGSRAIPRAEFIALLAQHCRPHQPGSWQHS